MGIAIIAFLLSVVVGGALALFFPGAGTVVAISIIGSILIYQNEKKK